VTPAGNGARGRGPGPRRNRKAPGRVKRRREAAPRWPSRRAVKGRSRALERASRGEDPRPMEGTPDRRSGVFRSRGCVEGGLGGPRKAHARERGAPEGGGDRSVRGPVRTRHGGKTTPTATEPGDGNVLPPEANRPERETGDDPRAQARKRVTHREPTRRGCWYEEREVAEVGPTHRASRDARSRKANRAPRRWPRRFPHDVLTHAAATPRRERCARCATLSIKEASAARRPG
jgi:hypothetical protein